MSEIETRILVWHHQAAMCSKCGTDLHFWEMQFHRVDGYLVGLCRRCFHKRRRK